MTAVITVPSSLDDLTFEQVLDQLAAQPTDAKVIIDARHCAFASPFGLTGLLTLAQTRVVRPTFLPPEDADKVTYWARAGFFRRPSMRHAGIWPDTNVGGADGQVHRDDHRTDRMPRPHRVLG